MIILASNKHVTLGECTNVIRFPILHGSTKLMLFIIKTKSEEVVKPLAICVHVTFMLRKQKNVWFEV